MKNEKMLEIMKELEKNPNNYGLIMQTIAALQEDIRTEVNKKAGKGSIEKAMKAILKNSEKLNRSNALKYAFYKNNFYYVCDSCRIFAYSGKIELPELPEDVQPMDYEKIFQSPADCEKITIPELSELKTELKILKAAKKGKNVKYYYKHSSGLTLNLQFLIDAMECGEKLTFYRTKNNAPMFFYNESGTVKGCILPVRCKENQEAGFFVE